jgi:nucleotide-binding universal stress UspA family protein
MEAAMISLKNILVATDFSEAADAALTYGRSLAGAFGATLHVLHVVDPSYLPIPGVEAYAGITPDLQAQAEEAERTQLDERVLDNDGSGPPTKKALRRYLQLWRGAA